MLLYDHTSVIPIYVYAIPIYICIYMVISIILINIYSSHFYHLCKYPQALLYSGCLHGCIGVLKGAADASLKQVTVVTDITAVTTITVVTAVTAVIVVTSRASI